MLFGAAMKLLLLLWWGGSATCAANTTCYHCTAAFVIMGTESGMMDSCQMILADDEEEAPPVGPVGPSAGKKAGPRPSANEGTCFICDEPGATVKFGTRGAPYFLHKGACHSAKRCHDRQVTILHADLPGVKDKDRQLLEKDPAQYKALIAPLFIAQNATRSQEALDAHRDKLTKVFFAESYTDKARMLMTKTR